MQEDQTFHCQAECGVFIVLPKKGVPEYPPSANQQIWNSTSQLPYYHTAVTGS